MDVDWYSPEYSFFVDHIAVELPSVIIQRLSNFDTPRLKQTLEHSPSVHMANLYIGID